jgi:hypothetical protein
MLYLDGEDSRQPFDFRRRASGYSGHRIQRMIEQIHALTDRTRTWQETTKLVGKVNRTLRGWANFSK